MAGAMDILIQGITVEDHEQAYEPWTSIKGFGIRGVDDSRGRVERFLKRNSITGMVAIQNGLIIGNILCRHDGRTGRFYHACAALGHRKHGIGYCIVRAAMETPQREGMSKIGLVAFKNNEVGNTFWQGTEWTEREDINSHEFILSEENIIRFMR